MNNQVDKTYKALLDLRKRTDLKLNPNPYLRPEYQLRYYQIIGMLHMYLVKRHILGDDTGLGKCSTGDTKIITRRGVLKLNDPKLWFKKDFNNQKEDNFYDIPSEIDLASDGIKKATKMYYGGKKATIKFKTSLGTWGHSTQNHRWKVMDPCGEILWKKTKDLKKGDYIAVGRNQNVWGYKTLDEDEAWLLGFIIGDGAYNIYNTQDGYSHAQLSIVNTPKPTIDKLKDITKKYFQNASVIEVNRRKNGYLNQTIFRESGKENCLRLFKKYGLKSGQTATYKTIPEIIKGCNKRTFCNFLRGLFDANGYISKEGNIELTLASKELIEDIQLYLLNMGIVAGILSKFNKKYNKNYYCLRILENEGKRKFYNWINFTVDYKKERLRECVYKEKLSDQTHDIIPFQNKRILNIHNLIPKNIRWAFKNNNRAKDGKGNLSYRCANRLLAFEHEEFFKSSRDFIKLKEIVSYNYFYAEITEIEDGGIQEVYDLSVPDGNTYLANGMISHNTLQTISCYATIKNKEKDVKLIIICPSSVMYQWASEVQKFCTGLTTQIVESVIIKQVDGVQLSSKNYLKGSDSRKHQFSIWENENKDIVIFNYNTMCSDWYLIESYLKKYKCMVVFDEATNFKNTKSMTWKYAREIASIADRAYGLSATIIKNDLLEAFSIFSVIMPAVLGNEAKFKKNYCITEKKQLWKGKGKRGKLINKIVGYKNLEFFNKAIDPYYLGRKKSDVAKELPEIISKEIRVPLLPKQLDLYEEALLGFIDYNKFNLDSFKNSLLEEETDISEELKEIKQIDKLTALIYCQQIANSPLTIGIDAPSAKEEELLRLIEQELLGEKIVIYTRFKKMVDRLERLITIRLDKKVVKITGDIDNKLREDYKTQFNTSEDSNIIIINSAAREGINLQSSAYLIFYDLPFSYGDFLQIIGRIHRIGSTHKNIFLIYLMGLNTVDEKTYQILMNKKELFDKVLGDSAVGAIKMDQKSFVNDLFTILESEAKNKI
jgi:SNF2 family DNA or RNA helicase